MKTMTETSTDKRVDDLRDDMHHRLQHVEGEMHRGFEQVDRRFEKVDADLREVRGEVHGLRAEMKSGFEGIDAKFDKKFDSLNRTIIVLLGGSLSVVTGGLIAAAFHLLS